MPNLLTEEEVNEFVQMVAHAENMNQKPTQWVVGAGVIDALDTFARAHASETDGQSSPMDTFLGISLIEGATMSPGRVKLSCDEWTAGAFTLQSVALRGAATVATTKQNPT